MNAKGTKGHKIIHATMACHILDGVNEHTRGVFNNKSKYPKYGTPGREGKRKG
jgi:hypothetical protein